ncbi:MAG TPA: hypothetical protein VI522_01830 [Gammaproteobacteria bacterium]|nr:hypothetical protein [Gammaproteobacteria bacterium]
MPTNINDTTFTQDKKRKRFEFELTDDHVTFHTYTIPKEQSSQEDVEMLYLQEFYPFNYGLFKSSWPGLKKSETLLAPVAYHATTTYPLMGAGKPNIENLVSTQRFLKDKDNGLDAQKREVALAAIEATLNSCDLKEVHAVNVDLSLTVLRRHGENYAERPRYLITITKNEFFTIHEIMSTLHFDFDRCARLDIAQFEGATKTGVYTTDSITGPWNAHNRAALLQVLIRNDEFKNLTQPEKDALTKPITNDVFAQMDKCLQATLLFTNPYNKRYEDLAANVSENNDAKLSNVSLGNK